MTVRTTSPKPRRKARLSRRGWVFAVAGFLGVPLAYQLGRTELLFVAWLALLLPALAFLFVLLRPMRLTMRRSFSATTLVATQPVTVAAELGNGSGFPTVAALWRDVLPWYPFTTEPAALRALAPRRARVSGRAGSPRGGSGSAAARPARGHAAALVEYELVPPRRGRFELGPFLVELNDPFGLAHSEIVVGEKVEILVTPQIESLSGSGLAVSADDGSARVQQLRALASDDDLMTRNYRIGDALRRVHWRASAHHGELMVRQEEQRSHAEARILLDTTKDGYGDMLRKPQPHQPQSESFEWAIRMTASLGVHLQRSGFLLQIVETGAPQLAPVEHYDEFRESLATIALSDAHAPAGHTLTGPRTERSLGVVFAVISDADRETVESLVSQRPQFDLALAIIVSPRASTIAVPLEKAGWRCIAATTDDSIEQLWQSLAPELETGHAWR